MAARRSGARAACTTTGWRSCSASARRAGVVLRRLLRPARRRVGGVPARRRPPAAVRQGDVGGGAATAVVGAAAARWRTRSAVVERLAHGQHPADDDGGGEDEPLHGVGQVRALGQLGHARPAAGTGRPRPAPTTPARRTSARAVPGSCGARRSMSRRWTSVSSPVGAIAELAAAALLRRAQAADDVDLARRAPARRSAPSGTKPRSTSRIRPSSSEQRRDDEVAGDAALRAVDDDELLVGQVRAGRLDRPPLDAGVVGRRSPARRRAAPAAGRCGCSTVALNAWRSSSRRSCQNPRLIITTMAARHEQVEDDPARRAAGTGTWRGGDGSGRGLRYGRRRWSCPTSTSRTPRRSSG